MRLPLGWTWPRGAEVHYCIKVAAATLIGYSLSFGAPPYAVFAAFSAALIVGTSRGEDTGSAANRVRGSLAAMLVSLALAQAAIAPAVAVALGIGITAYVCMGCGWGVSAARVGSTLCAVTLVMHTQDAIGYTVMRMGNTLIGIAVGLAVSYAVLPVRGRDVMARSTRRALDAVAELLSAVTRSDRAPASSHYVAVLDGLTELNKALRDARQEIGGEADTLRQTARNVALACIGALTAAVAYEELRGRPGGAAAAEALCARAAALAQRSRSGGAPPASSALSAAQADELQEAGLDEIALRGFGLGLHEIDRALSALGR